MPRNSAMTTVPHASVLHSFLWSARLMLIVFIRQDIPTIWEICVLCMKEDMKTSALVLTLDKKTPFRVDFVRHSRHAASNYKNALGTGTLCKLLHVFSNDFALLFYFRRNHNVGNRIHWSIIFGRHRWCSCLINQESNLRYQLVLAGLDDEQIQSQDF